MNSMFGSKQTIWFIGAHYDDIEIGCGGTCAKLIDAGHNCFASIVTKSGYTNEKGDLIRSNDVAREEGIKGLTTLGFDLKNIIHHDFETNNVFHDRKLIDSLESVKNLINPTIMFTHWTDDIHQDHRAVARSCLTVGRKMYNIYMYRSNWYKSESSFAPNCFSDIAQYIDIKNSAINCHLSEVTKFGSSWVNFIKSQTESIGFQIGTPHAEEFQIVKSTLDL